MSGATAPSAPSSAQFLVSAFMAVLYSRFLGALSSAHFPEVERELIEVGLTAQILGGFVVCEPSCPTGLRYHVDHMFVQTKAEQIL
jgi:hypothetical protein